MVNRTHFVLNATDRSYFALIKKEVHALSVSANFKDSKIAEIDIIIAEMVSNLVKHAGGGRLFIKLIENDAIQGIEVISVDSGPGMTDTTRMVADGVSTKNTLGHGLGAMKRLSDTFQVFSQKDWGTLILIRVFNERPAFFRKPSRVEIKSLLIPKPGEEKCGDGFFSQSSSEFIKIFLGDGLGHGAEAERAVLAAGVAFQECEETNPSNIIRHINSAVKKTRGLVGTVAVFDLKVRRWRICGIGNVTTRLSSPATTKNYMAYNGIIGLNVPTTLNDQEVEHENGQILLMCSDGIKTKWDVMKYPSISRYDLSILAATILKDHARNTDDMSVIACKLNLG